MLLRRLRVLRRCLRLKMSGMPDIPWGITLAQRISDVCCPIVQNRQLYYKCLVVFLTYIAYTCYHMTRKPISVVKAVLHRNCTGLTPPPGMDITNNSNWCSWAPFDGSNEEASHLLGELDSIFLFTYAGAMFVSGFVAERANIRYFLTVGMLFSGIFCYLFGIAKTYSVHNVWYYIFVQFGAGIFQTTGWPGVITVMTRWFGKSKKGLIFGLWNSHTSLGNIIGCLIPAEFVESDWAYSFIVPGCIMALVGMLLFSFLVVDPRDIGCETEEEEPPRPAYKRMTSQVANTSETHSNCSSETEDTEILIGEEEVQRRASRVTERSRLLPQKNNNSSHRDNAINFFSALKLPGVMEYSFCLFFSKLVSYTFLYWLPYYVNSSTTLSARISADLSTLFDVGGVIGAIAAGAFSDMSGMPAATCVGMLSLAAPMMWIYERFSGTSLAVNVILLILVGILVNGPYSLITTAVASELGSATRTSDGNNKRALATVTAIIDGTGSIGAAIGPLLASFVQGYGWHYVFMMLMLSDVIALLLLMRILKVEITKYRRDHRPVRIE